MLTEGMIKERFYVLGREFKMWLFRALKNLDSELNEVRNSVQIRGAAHLKHHNLTDLMGAIA